MKALRLLFDTVAVALGNLLNFNPTGWAVSQQEAIVMRERSDASTNHSGMEVEVIHSDGVSQLISQTGTLTPIQYLFKSMANMGVNLCFIYLGFVLIQAFLTAFIVLMLVAMAAVVVTQLMSWLSNDKSVPVPAAA